jgi:tetratricopeptide (TPR) repeat protein
MPEHSTPRNDLAIFIEGSHAFESALIALSAAESLTDELAAYILELTGLEHSSDLIKALHLCDFVRERNSEWSLVPEVREYLLKRLQEERPELFEAAHGRLLQICRSHELQGRFSEIPRYLVEGPGEAYHASALDPTEGLPKYAAMALGGQGGQQWLAARLAHEQEEFRILPSRSIEVDFLQGMVYYREGNIGEAERLLRRVSDIDADRREVAIALHIVGRLDWQSGSVRQAEAELNRSLAIRRTLRDAHGEAQVLHTLGQLVGRDRNRLGEAEELLRQSLSIFRGLDDKHGEARVLHTLGQVVGRDRNRWGEAEELLRQSLVIERNQNEFGKAQVLHTLGQLVGRDRKRRGEAEKLLRQSLAIGKRQRNKLHQAQVLHTLGQLVGHERRRRGEAEKLLRQSLAILRGLGDKHGQAQVLDTLGQLVRRDSDRSGEAEKLLRQSLTIFRTLDNDAYGEAQVLHTLGQLVGRDSDRSTDAEELLGHSVAILRGLGDEHREAQVLHTLGQLVGRDSDRSGEAEELLRRSLEMGEQEGNRLHQAQVLYSLGKLLSRSNREEGIRMLRRSLTINKEMDNPRGASLAERELRRLNADS